MKTCGICKQEFPATSEYFYKKRKSFQPICKVCDKQKNKAWNNKNKQRAYENVVSWRKANPGMNNTYSRNRRALEKGSRFEKYKESEVLDLYGTNCYLCDMPIDLNAPRSAGIPGWKTGLHIEHFIDIALGGPDTLDNVRPSHGWCNLTKPQKGKDSVELNNGTVQRRI